MLDKIPVQILQGDFVQYGEKQRFFQFQIAAETRVKVEKTKVKNEKAIFLMILKTKK